MGFLKKLFLTAKTEDNKSTSVKKHSLPLDNLFVENFIKNEGKFLYCSNLDEVVKSIEEIILENNWKNISCNDTDLLKLVKVPANKNFDKNTPVFIGCEHLIAENGSILLSSNQLKEHRISELSEHFIVYATTSQLVKTKGEGLTGIKNRYKGNIPSNIGAIKNYNPNCEDKDFMNYGNTNSKNLYLLLFEDL